MPISYDPQREHPSTYGVQDRSNLEEMQRLLLQDHLLNVGMSLLPEQIDPTRFTSVLDVGCGPGLWLIELAKAYPHISRLKGVDISNKMLNFARCQATVEGVGDRVEFVMMDALRMLEFPDAFFDLVNQRLGVSWLRTWDWRKLLQEYLRVVRRHGVIRVSETNVTPVSSSSPALMQLSELMLQALHQSGHFFRPTRDGITGEVVRLLSQHGVHNVQTCTYVMEHHGGMVEAQQYAENVQHLYRTMKPFLQKWIHLPNDFDAIYQQMVKETNQPDFAVVSDMMSAWGIKV